MTEINLKRKITKIIIEGPDCSGKSTLVERLKNALGWDSKSLRHKEGNQFMRYLKEYAEEEIVLDRSHFSENVYSMLWRGGSPFSDDEKITLDKISQINSLVIFAIPSLKEIKKRYALRSYEQQIGFEELQTSRQLFINELSNVSATIYHSRSFDELEKLLLKIRKIVQK